MDAVKKMVLGIFLAAVFGMFGMASVYGLRSFLADQPLFAVVFGSGLEGSKLSLVIGTHRQWPELGFLSRLGRSLVIIALIITTSAGVLGFMWLSHHVSTSGYQQLETRRAILGKEAAAIRTDLDTLETTIAQWPDKWVTKRLEAMKSAGYYEKQERLREILQELERLAVKKTVEYSGPVFATASIIKWVPEKIAKWYVFWLVMLGEAAGFWLMVLNSRAWRKDESEKRGCGDRERLPRRFAPRNDAKKNGNMGSNEMGQLGDCFTSLAMTDRGGRREGCGEHPSVAYLKRIKDEYGLTVESIADITDRKKLRTVENWLAGDPVPEKSMRAIRRWVNGKGRNGDGENY